MSVVAMKLLTMAGPLDRFDAVVRECVIEQDFHPENTIELMHDVPGLRPLPQDNPWAPLLRRAEELAGQMGVELGYVPFSPDREPQALGAYLDHLEGEMARLSGRMEQLEEQIRQQKSILGQLENLRGVGASLDELLSMRFVRFRYGYLPRETFDSFQSTLNSEEDICFFPTAAGQGRVYGVYFTTQRACQRVDTLFNSLHFTRIPITSSPHGTAEEAMEQLKKEMEQAAAARDAARQELESLCADERERLLEEYCCLRYNSECCTLRSYACASRESFYLTGWVPESGVEALQEKMNAFPRVSCVVDGVEAAQPFRPPTKLKNSFFGRIFHPFLEMYGLPAYNEADPSAFMALTYCLFFGIMFGDLGQGLCLALLGLVLARKKKMWLGNIITCCGLSGAIFGCVYGSVFGFEEILPGFKIMGQSALGGMGVVSNVLVLLVVSIVLGIAMLLIVMGINIANGVRQRNFEKIFFGPNGLAGVVFYAGILLAAVLALTGVANLFNPVYILLVIVLPLVLILLREPLSLLAARDPRWKRFSMGELLGAGFFELFETLLSYLTNTLSFMRVGAYAITHVGLMLVVQMLANLAGGVGGPVGIVILVLGNAFVMGFEGLLVGIQVLRLEFYELFGRFYDDGGVPFTPKKIDYSKPSNV